MPPHPSLCLHHCSRQQHSDQAKRCRRWLFLLLETLNWLNRVIPSAPPPPHFALFHSPLAVARSPSVFLMHPQRRTELNCCFSMFLNPSPVKWNCSLYFLSIVCLTRSAVVVCVAVCRELNQNALEEALLGSLVLVFFCPFPARLFPNCEGNTLGERNELGGLSKLFKSTSVLNFFL